jgi:hypothetical protein
MSAHAKVIPMPEPTYRESITRQGNWTAVPMPILRKMLDIWFAQLEPDEEASEDLAEADCIYWNDAGTMKPVRYYAARWRWGKTRTGEFLKARGLTKERTNTGQVADKLRTESPPKKTDSTIHRTTSGQVADNERTVLPDSDSQKEQDEEKKKEAREPFIALPTNRTGEEFAITADHVAEFRRCYPAIDVEQQLREMRAWSIANAAKRKTAGGMMRFVNGWLSRAQNDPKQHTGGTDGRATAGTGGVRGQGYAGNRTRRGAERSDEERIDEFERSIRIAESIIARGTGG